MKKSQQDVRIFECLKTALKILPRSSVPLILIIIISCSFNYFSYYIATIVEPQSLVIGGCWFILSGCISYLIGTTALNVAIKRGQKVSLRINQFFHAFLPSVAWRLLILGLIPFLLYQVWFKWVIKNIYLYSVILDIPEPNSAFDWLILPFYIGSYTQISLYYSYLLITSLIATYIAIRAFFSVCFVLDKNDGLIASLKKSFAATKKNAMRLMILFLAPPIVILAIEVLIFFLSNLMLIDLIRAYPSAYLYFVMSIGVIFTLFAAVLMYLITGVTYSKLSR